MTFTSRAYLRNLGFADAAKLVEAAGGPERAAELLDQSLEWIMDVTAERRPLPVWATKRLVGSAPPY